MNGAAKVTWVAAVFLWGCGTEMSLSRDAFVAAYRCPKDQVAVSGNGGSLPIEVVGCGHSAQYSGCCTSQGCVSVQDLAVSEASATWSCPKQQIQIGPSRAPDPPQPPADVAADPARLSIWTGAACRPCYASNPFGCGMREPGGRLVRLWRRSGRTWRDEHHGRVGLLRATAEPARFGGS
jgi:hypothetical protein